VINPNPRDLLNHLLAVSFSAVPEDVITTNVAGQIFLNLKTNILLKISIAVYVFFWPGFLLFMFA